MEYKVLVIKILLKNNKVAKSGEIVKESQLISPDSSVKNGFVEPVGKTKEKQKMSASDTIEAIESAESFEEIESFKSDERKTVQEAFAKKEEELQSQEK